MPFLAFALVVLILLLIVFSVPVTLVQRFRLGARRQPLRGWVASLNVWAFGLSTVLYLLGATVTDFWLPRALLYAVLGLAAGGLLGVLGLLLVRWEEAGGALHFTANRWLVLAITLGVAARIAYSFWRAWQSWSSGLAGGSWLVAAGAAESLGAGGLVLGYSLVFWWGVRRRFQRHGK